MVVRAANVVEHRSRCLCNGEHEGAKEEQFKTIFGLGNHDSVALQNFCTD